MPDWLQVYHHMPYPLRVLAASAHGYRLRWWRYGPETEDLVAAALERERWPAERWRAWQEERLAYILHRAATRVPYYREQWAERRRRGDRAAWDLLANWPVLGKEPLRANPRAFLADGCDPRRMYRTHTSGTTGTPLTLWFSREAERAWYALMEARWRGWHGVSRRDPWAILGGQLVAPFAQARPPFWVWNAGLNQLYMSSYHLAPQHAPAYLEAMARYRVRYVWGYASSLYALARAVLERGLAVPALGVAISNAEPLYDHQRHAIQRALACPVHTTYGMGEQVCAASECREGGLHLWPEAGLVEVLGDEGGQPLAAGKLGRLVATGLLNADMPLVRYELGDHGALAPAGASCPCGRTLPLLAAIEGRSDDLIVTPDGRRVGRLDPVFKADLPIREAQIIQERLDRVRVRLVPAHGYTQEDARTVARRLRQRLGDMEVVVEEVDAIPRSANGKFRAVVSLVGQGERPVRR